MSIAYSLDRFSLLEFMLRTYIHSNLASKLDYS
jgi:hypothetical protein